MDGFGARPRLARPARRFRRASASWTPATVPRAPGPPRTRLAAPAPPSAEAAANPARPMTKSRVGNLAVRGTVGGRGGADGRDSRPGRTRPRGPRGDEPRGPAHLVTRHLRKMPGTRSEKGEELPRAAEEGGHTAGGNYGRNAFGTVHVSRLLPGRARGACRRRARRAGRQRTCRAKSRTGYPIDATARRGSSSEPGLRQGPSVGQSVSRPMSATGPGRASTRGGAGPVGSPGCATGSSSPGRGAGRPVRGAARPCSRGRAAPSWSG